MKYYILKADERNPYPRVINWYGKIEPGAVNSTHGYSLPRFLKLDIQYQEEMIFTDIVSYPVFMVSRVLAQVIHYYDAGIDFKYLTLINQKSRDIRTYYLPLFDKIDCLAEESKLNMDKSVLIEAVIDVKKVRNKAIFCLAGVSNQYVCARLDIVESILKRGLIGIGLEEVYTTS